MAGVAPCCVTAGVADGWSSRSGGVVGGSGGRKRQRRRRRRRRLSVCAASRGEGRKPAGQD